VPVVVRGFAPLYPDKQIPGQATGALFGLPSQQLLCLCNSLSKCSYYTGKKWERGRRGARLFKCISYTGELGKGGTAGALTSGVPSKKWALETNFAWSIMAGEIVPFWAGLGKCSMGLSKSWRLSCCVFCLENALAAFFLENVFAVFFLGMCLLFVLVLGRKQHCFD
jgi:hypothetical protein